MNAIIDQTATPSRTQRFYCEGCQEWHQAESLLEAVRREGERMRLEKRTEDDDDDSNL